MNCLNTIARMILTIMLFVVPSISPAQAAEKKAKQRLAVLDLEATHGIEKSLAEALSVIVRDKLHSFGDYQVMSKGDLQAVASREQLLQALGCDDGSSQCLVDFGRAIGTRFMVAGDISKIGSTYTVSLRMLDTKGANAGVTNRVSEDCKCDDDALINTVRDVAAKLVGKPTTTAVKKIEEETNNVDDAAKKREAGIAEERIKIDNEKHRIIDDIENGRPRAEQKKITTSDNKKNTLISSTTSTSASPASSSYTDPTTGMEFVLVPSGCFQMGDTFGDGGNDEKPVHEVCVDAFYIGKYEVTQGEYTKIIGNNPSGFNKGERYPVDSVSWDIFHRFLNKLNTQSSTSYRLPTEAEWEYAARSGGKKEKYAGGDDIDAVAWHDRNSGGSTHPVGGKRPNGLGLYDMSGNVWEWCQDWYDSKQYDKSSRSNPLGPSSGKFRVRRGGGYAEFPGNVRATARGYFQPKYYDHNLGFRLVLPVQQFTPTVTPANEKKLAEVEKKSEEIEQRRLAEEKRKADNEKQRSAADLESQKSERVKADTEQKRITQESTKTTITTSSTGPSQSFGKTFTDPTTSMEFVFIPGGCFQMGDTFGDGDSNEKPVHEACVDAFFIGKYEVTQGEYQKVTDNNPSQFKKGERYPVENVSWNDAQRFIQLLNDKGIGNYRLPTEAEWEYAARSGGRNERFGTGKDYIGPDEANFDSNSTKPYSKPGRYRGETVEVGSFKPNSFGLYDMAGNVWEWCSDWSDRDYYSKSPRNNPNGPSSGSFRVYRGGAWFGDVRGLRSSNRGGGTPGVANSLLGFRLVLPVHTKEVDKRVSGENTPTERTKNDPDFATNRLAEEKRNEDADRQRQILEWRKQIEQK